MRRSTANLAAKAAFSARTGSASVVFALPYDDLQEIHTLAGMVCGWRMSLPKGTQYSQEILRLAEKARNHPGKKMPD